jgi:hypothetical protein
MKPLDHDCKEMTLSSCQRHGLPSDASEYLPVLREVGLAVGMVGILYRVSRDRCAFSEEERIGISGGTLNYPDSAHAEIGVWDSNKKASIS